MINLDLIAQVVEDEYGASPEGNQMREGIQLLREEKARCAACYRWLNAQVAAVITLVEHTDGRTLYFCLCDTCATTAFQSEADHLAIMKKVSDYLDLGPVG